MIMFAYARRLFFCLSRSSNEMGVLMKLVLFCNLQEKRTTTNLKLQPQNEPPHISVTWHCSPWQVGEWVRVGHDRNLRREFKLAIDPNGPVTKSAPTSGCSRARWPRRAFATLWLTSASVSHFCDVMFRTYPCHLTPLRMSRPDIVWSARCS